MKTQRRYAIAIGVSLVLAAPLLDTIAQNATNDGSVDSGKQNEAIEMRLMRRYRLIFMREACEQLRTGSESIRPNYAEIIRSNIFMYWFVTYESKVLPADKNLEKAITTEIIEMVAQYAPWEDPVPGVETENQADAEPILVDSAGIFLGVSERFFSDKEYHDAVEKRFYKWMREKGKK